MDKILIRCLYNIFNIKSKFVICLYLTNLVGHFIYYFLSYVCVNSLSKFLFNMFLGACTLPPVPEAAEYEISDNTSSVSTVREDNRASESEYQYQTDQSAKVCFIKFFLLYFFIILIPL